MKGYSANLTFSQLSSTQAGTVITAKQLSICIDYPVRILLLAVKSEPEIGITEIAVVLSQDHHGSGEATTYLCDLMA